MNWTLDEISILKKWYGKISADKIPLNKTARSIYMKAFRLGLEAKIGPKSRYSHNKKYFSLLNEECCYWAGFIAADGCIHDGHGHYISINLSNIDLKHLDLFKEGIQYTGSIGTYQNDSSIVIHNAIEIITDLQNYFSITSRKSLTLKPPSLLNENHIRAFIRGYMDGDGSISKHNKSLNVSFVGTYEMIKWIKNNINKFVSQSKNPSIFDIKNSFQIHFEGNIQSRAILEWLYTNSNNKTRLNRKYKIYEEYFICHLA